MTRAMIIGCGRFSGFQDPKNLNYYYGALKKTNIKLESIYDIDFNKSKKISKKFNLKTNNNLKTLYKELKPEIIIISSSIRSHYKNIKDILEFSADIKLLIIEKPLVDKFNKLKNIIYDLSKNKIKFIVNHTRRFDKNYHNILNSFSKSELPKEIHFNYYGQWINNGIHMIDLIFFFSREKKILKFNLYKKNNISLLKLYFKKNQNMTIHFVKGDHFQYQIADIDIFYKKKRIQILNHGEKYIYYTIKKNRIGELELKINRKLIKLDNSPLVNMLKLFNTNLRFIKNINFLKKNNLLNIYNLFFKLEKNMR